MTDYLVKAMAFNDQVRAYAVNSTLTVGEASRRHRTVAATSDAMGRSMTIGVMLGAMLKGEEQIMVKIDGGGPIGKILVDANARGGVRGFVTHPKPSITKTLIGDHAVKEVVGTNGLLTVTKDIGLKQPHIGYVPIESGDIVEDFNAYITNSEQALSTVSVGVQVNNDDTILAAGGFIVQLMPSAPRHLIAEINAKMATLPTMTTMVGRGLSPEELLQEILSDGDVRILDKMAIQFECQCSRERMENAIKSLGSAEIADMIATDGQASGNCHFCNEDYHFTKEQLQELL
ncbi:Hsp33 family molecular chaperone HslO [Kurthia sibirica]|uniref:33 kDa chaperonin n=1 Tax=Kurthia sibirica TaxID=202750 RepID=A0A2U3AJJ0_9BACL|nr:Hsp33 family molecular chaperone HslO [Kurthia sibirica]PWI24723.1 Hsp33 family molecular chaperone HslO [Kurthia sibirica]GEK34752.1 33 kDa chaperonin [Kurthia sibirica]